MNREIDLLAQMYRIILSWPEPEETAPSENLGGETEEAARTEPAPMGGSDLILHPQGEIYESKI